MSVLAVGLLAISTLFAGVASAASVPTTTTEISTAQDGKHGTYLVADRTVYTVDLDGSCTGKCAKTWLPVLLPSGVKKAKAGSGVDAAKLGTVKVSRGKRQITYDGDKLYWFAKDTSPGDVKGESDDKFGTATVVATKAPSGSDSGTTDTGTGGVAF